MRTFFDVLRSTQRYLALALPGWEVRIDNDMEALPFCLIQRTTPVTVTGNYAISDYSCGMRAACYPGPQDTEEAALAAAAVVEEAMARAFREGVALGRPGRIPLYDYTGVGMNEPALEADRHTSDYVRVASLSIQTLPEPEDRRLLTVLVAWTAQWRAMAGLTTPGRTMTDVKLGGQAG